MLPETRAESLLWDIREAASEALQFVKGLTYEQFELNRQFRLAVEREPEIIGEAARNISVAFKDTHSELPWKGMIAERNLLAHDYGDVDPYIVWRVIVEDLPALIQQLDSIIPSEGA